MFTPHVARFVAPIPPTPVVASPYKTTLTTTTNETTTTFSDVDIGTPHQRRIVILAYYCGVAAFADGTVNGIAQHFRLQSSIHEFGIMSFFVPLDTTATITLSAASSIRKAVSVYVIYPNNHMWVDGSVVSANTTTDANIADIAIQAGGCLIYVGGQHATLGDFTTTWNGTDTLVEDVDAQLESASSYTTGSIASAVVSSAISDINMAESVSGQKRLAVATWGPAYNVQPSF